MILTGHHLPPIEVDYILVTPDIAAEFMELNTGNRNEKPIKQSGMVRDMSTGNWIQTGEAIKFDWNGRMVDGQNRCRAIIRSGVSIPMLIVRELDPRAQVAMDSGTPRTSRDALHFAGVTSEKDTNAVANVHRGWNMGILTTANSLLGGAGRMTNQETVQYVADNPYVETAAIAAKLIYQRGLRLPVGAIGTAIVEFSRLDQDACEDFFQRITELRTSGHGDPIATLIKRTNDMKVDRQRMYEGTGLYLLFRTWNAYREGETLHKLILGNAVSGWSLIPEPK